MPFYRCIKNFYFRKRKWKVGEILSSQSKVNKPNHFREISKKSAAADMAAPPVPEIPKTMVELSEAQAPRPEAVKIVEPDQITKIVPSQQPVVPRIIQAEE